jgi:hypothetical protein
MVGCLSWKTDSTGVLDAHGHIPRQSFPVWHNLYWPQVTAGPFVHCQIWCIWCMDDMHRNFRCLGFLSLLWEWKHRQILTAEVGKILIVKDFSWRKEKRKTAYWGMQGNPETSDPWVREGNGFYSLVLHCLRVEMPFICKQAFSMEEKCLFDLLGSVLQYLPCYYYFFINILEFILWHGNCLLSLFCLYSVSLFLQVFFSKFLSHILETKSYWAQKEIFG